MNTDQQLVRKDVVLEVLVHTVNSHPGSGMSVTLTVQGAVVSGTLITNSDWFRLNAERMAGANEMLMHVFHGLADEIDAERASADDGTLDVEFLHLKDVHQVAGGKPVPVPGERGDLWRGRIGDVSGWVIGSYWQ